MKLCLNALVIWTAKHCNMSIKIRNSAEFCTQTYFFIEELAGLLLDGVNELHLAC